MIFAQRMRTTFFASERACALKNRKPKKWHPVFDYPRARGRARGISIPLTVNARGLWGRDWLIQSKRNIIMLHRASSMRYRMS